MVAWPAEHAAEVLERFRVLAAEAPESLGAVFRYLALPDIEAVPAPLRGRRIVAVIAAHMGNASDGRRILKPIRSSAGVLADTFGPIGVADLVRVAGDPEQPRPARGDGFLVGDLTLDLIEAVTELIIGDALNPLAVLELRLLGGALARTSEGHGALGKLDSGYSVFASGPVFDTEMAARIARRLEELSTVLAPWRSPQALLNSSGGGVHPADAFDGPTWERLGKVQEQVDRDRLILSNHHD